MGERSSEVLAAAQLAAQGSGTPRRLRRIDVIVPPPSIAVVARRVPKKDRYFDDWGIEIVCGGCDAFLGFAVHYRRAGTGARSSGPVSVLPPSGPGLEATAGPEGEWSKLVRQCSRCDTGRQPGAGPQVTRHRVVEILDALDREDKDSGSQAERRRQYAFDTNGDFRRLR